MRRRSWAGALVALAATAAAAEPLSVAVRPIANFGVAGSATSGSLEFLGGLEINSENEDFGGFSGISISGAGDRAFIISDTGIVVTAKLLREAGRVVGLADTEISPLFPDGEVPKEVGDAEDVAFDPTNRGRGIIVRERQANAMLSFEVRDGWPVNFKPVRVGAPNAILRSNRGLESVDYAPAASPAAGHVIAIAERPAKHGENIPGWIAGIGGFHIVPHDDFGISSARFLPDGDIILLERRYAPALGVALRLRRLDGSKLKPGAVLDGEYIIDVGMAYPIDNMEGLAVHEDTQGRTILTLVSDDNHSLLQRTLILEFALGAGKPAG